MKKVSIILSGIVFLLFSCQEKPKESKKNSELKIATIPKDAISELPSWFNVFSDPVLMALVDSIKTEYPRLTQEIKVLDSVKGLKVDFIGMMHSPMHDLSTRSALEVILDNFVSQCQCSIGRFIDTSRYLFIGVEESAIRARVSYGAYLKETVTDISRESKIKYGVDRVISIGRADTTLRAHRKYDYVLDKLISKQKRPYIIGAEPYWINLTAGMLRDSDLQNNPQLRQFFDLLTRCRSEIAVVRTVKELLKNGRKKKAAVLYGKDHIPDFQALAIQYGLTSKFILLKECAR